MFHFDQNGILSIDQFGFRKRASTTDALLCLQKLQVEAAENKQDFASVLIDLTRAFESVPHFPLLSKLKNAGIEDKALPWFESY